MAEGLGRERWAHTGALLALIANAHRDPKKHRAFTPADFNPYAAERKGAPLPKMKDLSILKQVFVDGGKGKGA